MKTYDYQARKKTGDLITGQIEAESVHKGVAKLQQNELLVVNIQEAKSSLFLANLQISFLKQNKIKLQELSHFCRQLAFMLEAGVSLIMGLQIIADTQAVPGIKLLAEDLMKHLKAGQSFAEACRRQGAKLPPLMVDMVAAAEIGGFLDTALENLANHFDKEIQTKARIKTAMIYPITIMVIALLAISVIFIYVVPVFGGILTGMNVPIPASTRIILKISLIFRNYWYIMLLSIITIILLIKFYLKTPEGKRKLDDLLFVTPIVKEIVQKVIVARFCRTMANLLHSGIPILQALDVVARTIGNASLKAEIEESRKNIRDGRGLVESFRQGKVFPAMVVQMLAVGEQSGNLDELLMKLGEFYDQEVAETTERLPKLIEPVMIVLLGVVVGGVVMGVLLPMFNVMSNIGL